MHGLSAPSRQSWSQVRKSYILRVPEDLHAKQGPFNISINGLKDGRETQLITFLQALKLEGIFAMSEAQIKMGSKLDELQRWP